MEMSLRRPRITFGIEIEMTYVFISQVIRDWEESNSSGDPAEDGHTYARDWVVRMFQEYIPTPESGQQIPDEVRAKNLPSWVQAEAAGIISDYTNKWHIISDGSVEHDERDIEAYFNLPKNKLPFDVMGQDMEIISPPFEFIWPESNQTNLEALFNTPVWPFALEQVTRTLRWQPNVGGAFASNSAGLHLHFSLPEFNEPPLKFLKSLFIIWAMSEPWMEAMHPVHRRSRDNKFSKSVRDKFTHLSLQRFAQIVNSANTVKVLCSYIAPVDTNPKYSKLWLSPAQGSKPWTLEFREHRGTVDAEEISWWIKFCTRMFEFAFFTANQDYMINGTEITTLSGVFTAIGMEPEGLKYYEGKVREYRALQTLQQ